MVDFPLLFLDDTLHCSGELLEDDVNTVHAWHSLITTCGERQRRRKPDSAAKLVFASPDWSSEGENEAYHGVAALMPPPLKIGAIRQVNNWGRQRTVGGVFVQHEPEQSESVYSQMYSRKWQTWYAKRDGPKYSQFC